MSWRVLLEGMVVVNAIGLIVAPFVAHWIYKRIEHRFDLFAQRDDVRFQLAHPKRVEHLVATYHALFDLRIYARDFRQSFTIKTDEELIEFGEIFRSRLVKAYDSYRRNRFYFSHDNIQLFDVVFDVIEEIERHGWLNLGQINRRIPALAKNVRNENNDRFETYMSAFLEKLRVALDSLENEIAKTIGTEGREQRN